VIYCTFRTTNCQQIKEQIFSKRLGFALCLAYNYEDATANLCMIVCNCINLIKTLCKLFGNICEATRHYEFLSHVVSAILSIQCWYW